MGYWNDKFQVGDIIRSKFDKQVVLHIEKVIHQSDVDKSGRYDETYYWTEYYVNDCTKFTTKDENKYELISKEIGPEQIKNFDKILVSNGEGLEGRCYWKCDFAAGWTNEFPDYKKRLMTISQPDVKSVYYNILPYNENTKYLVGTNLSMPRYYHYQLWVEDRINNIKEFPYAWESIDNISYLITYKL